MAVLAGPVIVAGLILELVHPARVMMVAQVQRKFNHLVVVAEHLRLEQMLLLTKAVKAEMERLGMELLMQVVAVVRHKMVMVARGPVVLVGAVQVA